MQDYDHLWDGSEEGWVVIRTRSGGTVYNCQSQMALLIEDEDERAQVLQQMQEHGRPFLDAIPKRDSA
ncbi:hypothetical protein AMK16_33060 [Streptomyces sp. CB00455]|uniref:hypothetical protein n=1 Tax=Streptomyces sp. CB00455 TaxID=1703927 RepID=UPI00093C0779|nr:hypothetical protein [Streptomyces sp. CB00455]OKK11143.1 hypothetical protein AMK16_33060 [Streptomyces sp. CB00455]